MVSCYIAVAFFFAWNRCIVILVRWEAVAFALAVEKIDGKGCVAVSFNERLEE